MEATKSRLIEECVPNSELVGHEPDHRVAVMGQSIGPRERDAPALWILATESAKDADDMYEWVAQPRVAIAMYKKNARKSAAQEIRFLVVIRSLNLGRVRRVFSSFGMRTSEHAAFLHAGPTRPWTHRCRQRDQRVLC
jgi:hypothetical protein